MKTAQRIAQIPKYLFAEIDKKRKEYAARGVDIISLGIGDPDQPTPQHVIAKVVEEANNPRNHRYPDYEGLPEFRVAAARWLQGRFGVELDPDREVMTVIGSKEGLAHIIWAFVDPGDIGLVPDPGYPVYRAHIILAGGIPHYMPLEAERGFLPDFDAIDRSALERAKLMFLNYPNNPTAGVADLETFARAVALARKYGFLLVHDCAYSEMTFDGYVAPSVLQVPGAKDVAIEFHSLSKPYNMTGWRIGFVAGSPQAVAALGIIKTNTDSGQFNAIQRAGIEALLGTSPAYIKSMNELYARRRDLVIKSLNAMGWNLTPPKGTFYVWVPVPHGYTSASFASLLLDEAGVIVTPGSAYGEHGEGFIRISLTVDESRIAEAFRRMGSIKFA